MEAVRHIFRVASSLDSMVVGEPQILGQIKEAYKMATAQNTSGVILNRLMHRAFHVAKRVRTETGICDSAVSISYAAVELAKKIFDVLEGKKVLLIGAGEMAELAARHLMSNGVDSLVVANRTVKRAMRIAEKFRGSPVSFDEIGGQLLEVDIVIASTASTDPIITVDMVKKSLKKRRNRPLFFIDIAVPRDVQSEVNDLDNVYLYDIDDLKGVIQTNIEKRHQEAARAERIVEEEVVKFEKWLSTLSVVPTIVSLREKVSTIVDNEMKKSRAALDSLRPEHRKAIQNLILSITEKIINDPILLLKEKADTKNINIYLDVTKKLFKMDETDEHAE
jgi:glutamyl-tRNA reductase